MKCLSVDGAYSVGGFDALAVAAIPSRHASLSPTQGQAIPTNGHPANTLWGRVRIVASRVSRGAGYRGWEPPSDRRVDAAGAEKKLGRGSSRAAGSRRERGRASALRQLRFSLGTGNGLFSSSPFKISDFWPVASPGKTLCLLDGTYTGAASMILPPQGLNGASGLPITIRALNDGKVLINGQGVQTPRLAPLQRLVRHRGHQRLLLHRHVVAAQPLQQQRHSARRSLGCRGRQLRNLRRALELFVQPFGGCCRLGNGRKIFSASQGGDYTTIRRAWGRWERSTVVGPKMTYTLAYNNYHLTCENCLGTWSGQGMPETYVLMGYDGNPWTGTGAGTYTNYAVNQPYGIFGVDGLSGDKNAYARLLGSLAYVLSTDTYKAPHVVFMTNVTPSRSKTPPPTSLPGSNLSVLPFGLYGLGRRAAQHLVAENLTAFGGAPSVFNAWLIGNVWAAPSPITGYAPARTFSTPPAVQILPTAIRTAASPTSRSGPGP